MRKSIVSALSLASAFALPLVASAQNSTTPQQGIIGLIQFANTALNDVMVLLITAAIVGLFYGVVMYVFRSSQGGEAKAGYLKVIFSSVIALFIMVSIWGVIHLLQATFGVSNSNSAETPSQIQIGGTYSH